MNIFASIFVAASLMLNFINIDSTGVKNYIDRKQEITSIYASVLDRAPSTTEIMTAPATKALVCNLLKTDEFYNKNTTEEDIINKYYNIFRGKNATQEEIAEWKEVISTSDTTLLRFELINSGYFNKKYNLSDDYFNKDEFIVCTNDGTNDFCCEYTEDGTYKFYVTFNDGSTYYHEVKNAI